MMKILIATGNAGKLAEFRALLAELDVAAVTPAEIGMTPPDVAETGTTFLENARLKAHAYARASGLHALADDSGLEVAALGGAPGVRSSRFAGEDGNAAKNIRKLLTALEGEKNRSARFVCQLVLSDGENVLIEAHGRLDGTITAAPAGSNGFGYDPVFLVPALGKTMAELSPDRKNALSHRKNALDDFKLKFSACIKTREHPGA